MNNTLPLWIGNVKMDFDLERTDGQRSEVNVNMERGGPAFSGEWWLRSVTYKKEEEKKKTDPYEFGVWRYAARNQCMDDEYKGEVPQEIEAVFNDVASSAGSFAEETLMQPNKKNS